MAYCSILEKLCEENIRFFRKNKRRKSSVSIEQVFEEGYHDMNRLINANNSKKPSRKEQEKLLEEWHNSRPRDFYGIIPLSDNTEIELEVEYRTNMNPGSIKQPNIIHLMKDRQTVLVLRRPRFYNTRQLKSVAGSFDFDIENSAHEEIIIQEVEKAHHIPEQILTEVLESYYYEEGYPRITPQYKFIEERSQKFFIREYLGENVEHTPLEPGIMAEHIGFLQSLGLVSRHDRQVEHYFISGDGKPSIVNIDPDFMVWVPQLYGNDRFNSEIYREDIPEAEEFRLEMQKDEEEFLDIMTTKHKYFTENGKDYKRYADKRNEFVQEAEELSLEFIHRVNSMITY